MEKIPNVWKRLPSQPPLHQNVSPKNIPGNCVECPQAWSSLPKAVSSRRQEACSRWRAEQAVHCCAGPAASPETPPVNLAGTPHPLRNGLFLRSRNSEVLLSCLAGCPEPLCSRPDGRPVPLVRYNSAAAEPSRRSWAVPTAVVCPTVPPEPPAVGCIAERHMPPAQNGRDGTRTHLCLCRGPCP